MDLNKLLFKNLRSVNFVNNISSKGLAITTIFAVNGAALPWATQNISAYAPIVSAIIAIAVGLLIDDGLRRNFVLSLLGIFNVKEVSGTGRFLIICFFVFAVSRLFLSTSATFMSTYFIKDAVVEKPDIREAKAATEASVALRKKIIFDAQQKADKISTEAETTAHLMVKRAIESKGSNIAALYRNNDPYVMTSKKFSKYRRLVDRAHADAALLKKQAYDQAERITLAAKEQAESERTDEGLKYLMTYEQKKVIEADAKAALIGKAIYGIDAILALMFLLTSIVMVGAIKEDDDYIDDFFPDTPSITDEVKDAVRALMLLLTGGVGSLTANIQMSAATLLDSVATKKGNAQRAVTSGATGYKAQRNRAQQGATKYRSTSATGSGYKGGSSGSPKEQDEIGIDSRYTRIPSRDTGWDDISIADGDGQRTAATEIEFDVNLTDEQKKSLRGSLNKQQVHYEISRIQAKIRSNRHRIGILESSLINAKDEDQKAAIRKDIAAKQRKIDEYSSEIIDLSAKSK